MLKGKEKAEEVDEEQAEIEVAEKKSIGNRIKGWFSKDKDEAELSEDPLFADIDFSDLEKKHRGSNTESNGGTCVINLGR
ncbi:MAG: hypothetical protein R3C11_08075 [Planctomycetaceae bacterium]